MEVAQVRKVVDLAKSMDKFNSIEVLSTTGMRYRNNQSSLLSFNDGDEMVSVIRTNNDPARIAMNSETMEVCFVMYEDISAINFLSDPMSIKDHQSEIGSFETEDVVKIVKFGINDKPARGFSDLNKEYVSSKDATPEKPATIDPKKMQPWEVVNAPFIS